MAWIEFHQELPRHPKTDVLMDELGVTRATAVGHIGMSFLWALEFASDGFIAEKRMGAAARGSDWQGPTQTFTEAMVAAGWWDETEGGYLVHNWERYIGKLLEKRRTDAERKAKERDGKGKSGAGSRSVQRTSAGHPRDGAGKPTVTNHDQPTATNQPTMPCAHEASPPAGDDEHPSLDETTASGASSQTPQPETATGRQNDEVPPRRAPLRAMAHVETGPWRFTADHLEALDAAAEGQGFEARDLPGRIGAAIGKRVSWGKNPAETFDAWYALTEDEVIGWCEEAMCRARLGGSDPRSVVGLAAAIAADKLTVGVDLTAKVVQLPAAPIGGQPSIRGGRQMSNQERTMAVLREAAEDERRRMAGGGS